MGQYKLYIFLPNYKKMRKKTTLYEYGYLHGSEGDYPRFLEDPEYMKGFEEGRKYLYNQQSKLNYKKGK